MKKIITAGLIITLLGVVLLYRAQISIFGPAENANETYTECERHYVLITNGENDDFWDHVYQSALAEGLENQAYVERFGSTLSVDYTRNELLKIALLASVDGVIVEADEDKETQTLIDALVNANIPVVTALKDCSASLRQCYVGSNNYDTGVLYGQKIADLMKGRRKAEVLVVSSGDTPGPYENLILLGIRETVAELLPNCKVKVDIANISRNSSFAEEEYYNSLFMDDDLPDVLICQNALGTICAYQSAIDHNQVGKVEIIGFYDSPAILAEVQKKVLTATLSIDAEQIGISCVRALEDYYAYGYTSGYQAVRMALIDSTMAAGPGSEEVEEE